MPDKTKSASMNLEKNIFRYFCSVKIHKVYIRYNNGSVRVMTPYDTPWWGIYYNVEDMIPATRKKYQRRFRIRFSR